MHLLQAAAQNKKGKRSIADECQLEELLAERERETTRETEKGRGGGLNVAF